MIQRAIETLPVAVIGAGPIGLAAAAHLIDRGLTPLVLEAGSTAGHSIRSWGHVRVFSPWKYMVDPLTRGMLEAGGWVMPDEDALPTGGEFVRTFVQPLADLPVLGPHIRYGHRVIAVTRLGFDKVKSAGRESAPFEIVCRTAAGQTVRLYASAVIDASGTYGTPSPIGSSGLAIEGEDLAQRRIAYGIPDVRGRDRPRYENRRTLVVGSGHSAFNALLDLAWLKTEAPATEIVWAVRRAEVGLLFGGGAKDALPARGSLGAKLRQLIDLGVIEMVTGFRTSRVVSDADRIVVSDGERRIGPVDEIVAATGFRPELGMLREMRLGLDPVLEAPVQLAPLIDPNVHSCGTVYPHGYEELRHPETGFFIVGMKSYGRAPTFLLLTGYEQVRSVVSALSGDMKSARDVRLVLPETGVCSSDAVGGAACCSRSAPPVEELAGVGAVVGVAAGLGGAVAAGAAAGGGCGCG